MKYAYTVILQEIGAFQTIPENTPLTIKLTSWCINTSRLSGTKGNNMRTFLYSGTVGSLTQDTFKEKIQEFMDGLKEEGLILKNFTL